MQRVQIDLSAQERQALQVLAQRSGRSQSSLIRGAIDGYLEREQPHQRLAQLRQARGLWAGRDDLPDWPQLRQELDRHATFPY
jgi:predicted transcriptional regulator